MIKDWDKFAEHLVISIAFFVGFAALFYSSIDNLTGSKANIYLLWALAIFASGVVFYLLQHFDNES